MNKVTSKEGVEFLKEVCNENIEIIFDHLGIDVNDQGRYFNCPCPFHLGDNPRGFSWQKELGIWQCFTHNCQDETGSDVFGLVIASCRTSFPEAVKILQDLVGREYDVETIERIRNKKVINNINVVKKKTIPEEHLNVLGWDPMVVSYMVQERGFSDSVLREFDIRYAKRPGTLFYKRIVLPIRDEDGDLVGATARWANKDTGGRPKWLHEGNVNDYLYGFYKTHEHIQRTEKIVLVEGPLGVIKLWEAGIRNAVAVFGTSISRRQQRAILASGAYKLYVAFDNDLAGNRAADRVLYGKKGSTHDYLGGYMDSVRVDLGDYSDLDEMSVYEIREIFQRLKEKDSG
jgi:DNA primase